MKRKLKRILVLLTCTLMLTSTISVQARPMQMYICGNYVTRNIECIGKFDMLPVLDIANELGYNAYFNGRIAVLYNDQRSYTFVLGQPAVFDQNGREYGLDVVPQIINGKLMIPAKFFYDAMGKTYTWDAITDTLFLDSDYTYYWLINTPEYRQAKTKIELTDGTWVFEDNSGMTEHDINMEFYPDGTCYYETWRVRAYGIYEMYGTTGIIAEFDIYYNPAGSKNYEYYYSETNYFTLSNGTLTWVE